MTTTALAAAQAAIAADRERRETECLREIEAALEKHRCRLVVRPQLHPTENGGLLLCPPRVEAL